MGADEGPRSRAECEVDVVSNVQYYAVSDNPKEGMHLGPAMQVLNTQPNGWKSTQGSQSNMVTLCPVGEVMGGK